MDVRFCIKVLDRERPETAAPDALYPADLSGPFQLSGGFLALARWAKSSRVSAEGVPDCVWPLWPLLGRGYFQVVDNVPRTCNRSGLPADLRFFIGGAYYPIQRDSTIYRHYLHVVSVCG